MQISKSKRSTIIIFVQRAKNVGEGVFFDFKNPVYATINEIVFDIEQLAHNKHTVTLLYKFFWGIRESSSDL